jgi:IclR family acetate operon transcriptional repressor
MTQLYSASRNTALAQRPNSRYSVKAVDKALRILESIGTDPEQVGLAELSRRLGIEKSTLYRLLETLEARRFVRKDPSSLRYALGIRMVELGTAATARSALGRAAGPVLDRLMLRSRQTVNLAVLDGEEILYIAKREPPEPLRVTVEVGRRVPAHATALGKVMLAFRPPGELQQLFSQRKQLVRFTPNTITSPRKLMDHLKEVRRVGIALDAEELVLGARCLAAPVLDSSGCAVAAISIAAPAAALGEKRARELCPLVVAGAAEITKVLIGT